MRRDWPAYTALPMWWSLCFAAGCTDTAKSTSASSPNAQAPQDSGVTDTDDGPDHDSGEHDSGSTDTGQEAPADTTVRTSGVIVCADPDARTIAPMEPWTLGLGWTDLDDTASFATQYGGSGLATGDLNGDGQLDIVLPRVGQTLLWMAQGDDTWADESAARLPPLDLQVAVGAVLADVEGDGDLDIYLTGLREPNVLLINDGSGVFTDGTATAGVGGEDHDSISAAFADWDQDGDLDLAVANHREDGVDILAGLLSGEMEEAAHPNVLYQNNGDGTFTTQALPTSFQDGFSFLVAWHDLDADGDLDLYAVNDLGPLWIPNQVLINDSGSLREVEMPDLEIAIFGMGLGVGDLSGDGAIDLLMSSWNDMVLLESDETGGWYDGGPARGLLLDAATRQVGWGAELSDLDNDGDLDALMAFGPIQMPDWVRESIETSAGYTNEAAQPDAVWLQDDAGQFTDVATAWDVADSGVGRGFLSVDLDGDGWLDLIKRDINGHPIAHRARCGDASWLSIELQQPTTNPFAIGAHIQVEAGDQTWHRAVRAGGTSFASSGPSSVHFGLGPLDRVDRIVIDWPDGHQSVLEGLQTRQVLNIERIASTE